MNKITNEDAYKLHHRGYSLPIRDNYEDQEMFELAKKEDNLYKQLRELKEDVKEKAGYSQGYILTLYTDQDFSVTIKGQRICYEDTILFKSLQELEDGINNCILSEGGEWFREFLDKAVVAMKNGEDFYDLDTNQQLYVRKL